MPEVKAGYRFVPLVDKVCPSPTRLQKFQPEDTLLSHGLPLANGVSGLIEVTWKTETPFCVGEQRQRNAEVEDPSRPSVVTPFRLGDRFAIPGASIKGMLRSAVEILSFSHLGKINAGHRFGFRDYRMNEYTSRVVPNDIKAGWLLFDARNSKWYLAPARGPRGFHYLEIDLIERQLEVTAWKTFDLEDKRARIRRKLGGERIYFASVFERNKSVIDVFSNKPHEGWREGYVAFSGPVNIRSNKKYEAVIEAPMAPEHWHLLPPRRMEEFAFINSKTARDRVAPEGSWKYWLDVSGWEEPLDRKPISGKKWDRFLPGIPVFYTGDPASEETQGRTAFHMGLSRVIKVGYDQSVGQVAARTMGEPNSDIYGIPSLTSEKLDFARAIFGDVEVPPEKQEAAQRQVDPEALKGRVACGFALAPTHTRAEERVHHTVFMGPRASFWPFYLRDQKRPGQSVSYNSPLAVLAGRKRYPAREPFSLPTVANEKQNKIATDITFLPKDTTFEGQIRFHNLAPEELGALLAALALGQERGPTRHSLGHAKSLGYGRLACSFTLVAKPNKRGADPLECGQYIQAFRKHMEGWYQKAGLPGDWCGSAQVQGILKMSYPVAQEAWRGALDSLKDPQEFGTFKKGNQTLPDYSREFDRLAGKPAGLGGFLLREGPCGNGI